MIRRSVAGAILGVSLLLGSFAWSGYLSLRTVFDPDRSTEVAQELLDNDEVRSQLSENLSFALRSIIPQQVEVSDELIDGTTEDLLNNPAVEATILNAFADTHAAFLGEGDAPERIDLTAVVEVARESLVTAAPELDSVIDQAPILSVPLPTERVPNAKPVRSFVKGAVPILAALAVAGALLALIATNDRPSILRRAGVWALTTTAIYLAIGLGVPWLLREYAPDQAEVVAALLAALLRSTLVPSIALAVAGVALLALAAMWASVAGRERAPRAAKPERAPYADAPHRRRVAAMDQPGGRPAADLAPPVRTASPPATYEPAPAQRPVPRAAPAAPQRARAPQPAPAPRPDPTEAHPAAPAPRPDPAPARPAAAAPSPTPSPYPDDEHYRDTHPDDHDYHAAHPRAHENPRARRPVPEPSDQPPPAPSTIVVPGGSRPGPQRSPHSIFDDVPTPQPGAPPSAPVDPTRSVFATPPPEAAPPASAQPASRSSVPPAGARFSPEHGWVLDPESPDPLPLGAVWVDGVGYVLPA